MTLRLQRGMLFSVYLLGQRATNYRVNDVIRSIEFN